MRQFSFLAPRAVAVELRHHEYARVRHTGGSLRTTAAFVGCGPSASRRRRLAARAGHGRVDPARLIAPTVARPCSNRRRTSIACSADGDMPSEQPVSITSYPAALMVSVTACLMGAVVFGYHLGVLNTTQTVIASDLNFSLQTMGSFIVSILLLGSACSCYVSSHGSCAPLTGWGLLADLLSERWLGVR